jgi:Uma2 family endonuclease
MTIQEWKEQSQRKGLSAEDIAILAGLPVETVREVIWGTQIPKFAVWERLDEALKKAGSDMVREALNYSYVNKRQDYNIDDYLAIPDGIRVELIDGVIYEMATPTNIHQVLIVHLVSRLFNYIQEKEGKCVPFVAPLDVKPSEEDNKTVVQPDVFVVCDRDVVKKRFFESAPDLVIEILSPSTKKRDSGIKLRKYKETGVREYWIVDPIQKHVVVHHFEFTDIPKAYGFDAKVPVGIFAGKCEIDFAEIYKEIEFMYE